MYIVQESFKPFRAFIKLISIISYWMDGNSMKKIKLSCIKKSEVFAKIKAQFVSKILGPNVTQISRPTTHPSLLSSKEDGKREERKKEKKEKKIHLSSSSSSSSSSSLEGKVYNTRKVKCNSLSCNMHTHIHRYKFKAVFIHIHTQSWRSGNISPHSLFYTFRYTLLFPLSSGCSPVSQVSLFFTLVRPNLLVFWFARDSAGGGSSLSLSLSRSRSLWMCMFIYLFLKLRSTNLSVCIPVFSRTPSEKRRSF